MKIKTNKLFTTALAGSLMTVGALMTMKPAEAVTLNNGDTLQLTTGVRFLGGLGNPLDILFALNNPPPDFAPVGDYGTFTINESGTTGGFSAFEQPGGGIFTVSDNTRIQSVGLPAITFNDVAGRRFYIGPGSPNGPQALNAGGNPFLTLSLPIANPFIPTPPDTAPPDEDPSPDVLFFFDTITEFSDSTPSSIPVKDFTIGGIGRWIDATTNELLGTAVVSGTFNAQNFGAVGVDLAGNNCNTPGVGNCRAATDANFIGTFQVVVPPAVVPEPASTSALIAFGVLGGSSLLLKRKKDLS